HTTAGVLRCRSSGSGPSDLGAYDRLVQAELTIQFLDRGRFGGQFENGVNALGLLVDLVGQAALTPHIDVVNGAAVLAHLIQVRLSARRDRALIEIGVKNDHDFIVTQGSSTSFGLSGYGRSVA